jgi:hypothetical protein
MDPRIDPRIDPRMDPRIDPRMALGGMGSLGTLPMRSLYGAANDPYYYKYNMLAPTDPIYKYADMDLYFYRKQALQDQARVQLSKSATLRQGRKKVGNSKSPASSYAAANTLPPLIVDRNTNNISKIELEEKTQEVLVKDEEVQTLKAKLKRMEHLLGLKDARIQDLQSQLDKLKPNKRLIGVTNNINNNQTPVTN